MGSNHYWTSNPPSCPDSDTELPSQASNVRPNGWTGPYTTDTTPSFRWDAASDADSGLAGYYVAVDDWTPEGSYGNDWWVGDVTAYTVPTALPDGEHIFAVTSKDNAGNVNPGNTDTPGDAPYYTFYVDNSPPPAPSIIISGSGCTGIQNNVWQNTCYDPAFTWSATDSGSGVQDYHYYWGTSSNGAPTTQTTATSFDPGAIAPVDGHGRSYLNVTARDTIGHASGVATFGVLYDNTTPTVTLQINNGAKTANQVDVTLDLSAGDTGSGVDEVCVSNNANDCTDWQPYADTIPWTMPALNRREHTVYVWVRDKAGNEASASDTITLDLYPPKPHSASYRICDDVIDVGGGVGLTSTTYSLVSAIGQPWATGAEANASDAFGGRSGFLSSITGCLPITYAITSNYTVTQWVIASGGNLRGSASYRLGDTTGQPAASNTNAFTSTSYTLSSGFWAQITGTVPTTSTTNPTPILPTPTPSPTPGPTPTPQPGGFGVSINEGALYTNDSDVTVSVWAPNVTHMRLSNDGGFVDSHWRSYQVTSTWVISTYGSYVMPRFVYAQFRDAQNTIYGTYVDDIIYDPVAPQGQVQVLGSEFVTATLWLEAYDDNSGVSQMRIADSFEELNSALWEPYESTRSWVLDNSRVYVQFKDRAGNESLIYDSTGTAHALNSRPTGVSIQGQKSGARDTAHYFIASVSPTTVTLPLTYTWQATGQAPVTHTHQFDASDVVSFTWEIAGPKIITATAANSLGAVSNVRTINISSLTAEVSKAVSPTSQVAYGDELTYTLVISAEAGTQLSLYDPMTETTCLHFVDPLKGLECVDDIITGTLEVTPTNQVTVSFVTQVGVPGTVGWTTDVSNRACVYPVGGTIQGDCIWSNEVMNEALHPYNVFLPLVFRD